MLFYSPLETTPHNAAVVGDGGAMSTAGALIEMPAECGGATTVSYTHLDVYKRQSMIKAIETYLAMRRTTGFTLSNAEYLLRSFASFATHQKQTHIRTATVIQWAGQARSVAQRQDVYKRQV